jgi:hypothetical protein
MACRRYERAHNVGVSVRVTWTPVDRTTHSMVPLRRNRDFLVLWSAQLVSTLGSQVSLVAATGTTSTLLACGACKALIAATCMTARSLRNAQPIPAAAHA